MPTPKNNLLDLERSRWEALNKLRKQPELLDCLPPVTQLLILRNLLGIPPSEPSPSAFLEEDTDDEEEMDEEEEMEEPFLPTILEED